MQVVVSPELFGALIITLVLVVILLMFYMVFGRTELLRIKLLACLKSFELVNSFKMKETGSKYFETLDASFSVSLVRDKVKVHLIKCTTHGQLAQNYYLVLENDNAENIFEGIYGTGRIPRALRRNKVILNQYNFNDLDCESDLKKLMGNAESLEVNKEKLFIFFPLGSLFGYTSIFKLAEYLEN